MAVCYIKNITVKMLAVVQVHEFSLSCIRSWEIKNLGVVGLLFKNYL